MKKYIYIVIIIAMFTTLNIACKKKDDEGPEVPQISFIQPERGPIKLSVASTGRVASNLDVEIKCKASGQVISLPFDISDEVKEGELVVELDPVDEQRNVSKSEVSLSSSKARLAQSDQNLVIATTDLKTARQRADVNLKSAKVRADDARAKADRMKELYDRKLVGLEEYETAETAAIRAEADLETAKLAIQDLDTDESALELRRQDVILSKADVQSAEINLSIAKQRLDDTKVYAPIDGIVTSRVIQTGQIISSGISNTGGGTTIMTLSDLSRLYVLASVDESDIGRLEHGQKVIITADAYAMMTFEGTIDRIAQMGVNQSNVVTFEVRIEILSKNKSLLKPEMTTNIEVIVAEKDDVLAIPVGALSRVHGQYFVSIQKVDGTTEEREVEIGINNGEMVEIVSGLAESDTVVVSGGAGFSQWKREGGPGGNNPARLMGGMKRK